MAKATPREFKIETVKLSYQTDKQLGGLASDLGISRSSLSNFGQGDDSIPGFWFVFLGFLIPAAAIIIIRRRDLTR